MIPYSHVRVFVWEPAHAMRSFLQIGRRSGLLLSPANNAQILRIASQTWRFDGGGELVEAAMRPIDAHAVLRVAETASFDYLLAATEWPSFTFTRRNGREPIEKAYAPLIAIASWANKECWSISSQRNRQLYPPSATLHLISASRE
jgi:hypothetical protein